MNKRFSFPPAAFLSSAIVGVLALSSSFAQAADDFGAKMPFTTIEAESPSNKTSGRVVAMSGLPARDDASPELEASGRAFVELDKTGQFLEIPYASEVNGLILRHCIPDAPAGGGKEETLSVYVNGKFRQKITLSSKFNWLYGEKGKNGQSNDPAAGTPHVFWDDTRFLIEGGLKAGDTLRLQKDEGDRADFYRIDLVDLEAVPSPLAVPAEGTFLSVAGFGAKGDDEKDDTEAIRRCVEQAKSQRKTVWIPAGTYRQSEKIVLDGVAVQGAGLWHTTLLGIEPGKDFGGALGFFLAGDGAKVSDMTIASEVDTARSMAGNKPFTARNNPKNWTVENVCIMHTNVGFWMSGADKGLVRGCRLHLLYADGINVNRGSSHNVIENNYVRGIGDDGVVTLSGLEHKNTPDPISTANILRHNTVIANWWGHNCSVSGGNDHVVEYNYLADNSRIGCLTINLTGSYPKYPSKDNQIRNNMIVRGGGNHSGQKRGAIWINAGSTTITNARFRDNIILDPIFRGIHLRGGKEQEITCQGNTIVRPGEDAIVIDAEATGSAKFIANVVRNLGGSADAFENKAGSRFKVVLEHNSWQSSAGGAAGKGAIRFAGP